MPDFDPNEENAEADLNYLMSIALDKITFLPFGYLMDKFRWTVFAGETQYQQLWDEYRLKYQVSPLYSNKTDYDCIGINAAKFT